MKNLTPAGATRLGVYILGAVAGLVLVVIGALNGDWQMIGTGLPLLGVSAIAAPNVPATAAAEPPNIDDELADLEDDEPKHAAIE